MLERVKERVPIVSQRQIGVCYFCS